MIYLQLLLSYIMFIGGFSVLDYIASSFLISKVIEDDIMITAFIVLVIGLSLGIYLAIKLIDRWLYRETDKKKQHIQVGGGR